MATMGTTMAIGEKIMKDSPSNEPAKSPYFAIFVVNFYNSATKVKFHKVAKYSYYFRAKYHCYNFLEEKLIFF